VLKGADLSGTWHKTDLYPTNTISYAVPESKTVPVQNNLSGTESSRQTKSVPDNKICTGTENSSGTVQAIDSNKENQICAGLPDNSPPLESICPEIPAVPNKNQGIEI
jgi:hypothetical protein